jgi:hypothetical protein
LSRFYFLSGKRTAVMVRQLRSALLLASLALLLAPPARAGSAGKNQHFGDGFSIDLDEAYDRVLEVVKNVSEDGIVRGTSEYKGSAELYGAVPGTTSKAFHSPPVPGTVLYKVRTGTIAPEHFYQSNDVGTVTVRYVVKSLGPQSTRLAIDAIFQEESHHHYHPSDGTVENSEFLAISDEIKDLDDRDAKAKQDAVYAVEEKKIAALLTQLDQARADLKAANAREQELAKKVHAVSGGKPGQVRTASADLKNQPYNESKTLRLLSQGEAVTVLLETRSWSKVQTANGQQGWVYRLMLEAPQ